MGTSRITYYQRALAAVSVLQKGKRSIHVNSIRAQVRKDADARNEKLGPSWAQLISKAVKTLEEEGLVELISGGSIAIASPTARKTITAVSKTIASPESTSRRPRPSIALTPTSPRKQSKRRISSVSQNAGDYAIHGQRRRSKRFKTVHPVPSTFVRRATSPLTELSDSDDDESQRHAKTPPPINQLRSPRTPHQSFLRATVIPKFSLRPTPAPTEASHNIPEDDNGADFFNPPIHSPDATDHDDQPIDHQLHQTLAELQIKLSQSEEKISHLQHSHGEAKDNVILLNTLWKNKSDELDRVVREANISETQLRLGFQQKETDIANDVKIQLIARDGRISSLENEKYQLETQITQFEGSATNLQTELLDKNREYDSMVVRLQDIESELTFREKEILILNGKVVALEQVVKEQDEEVSALRNGIMVIEARGVEEVATRDTQISELTSDSQLKKQSISILEDKALTMGSILSDLQKELDDAKMTIGGSERAIASLTEVKDRQEKIIADLKTIVGKVKARHDEEIALFNSIPQNIL